MDTRFNPNNHPVASNTEPKDHTNPSRPLTNRVGRSKREMKEITIDFPILPKRTKHTALNPVETSRSIEKINNWPATSIQPCSSSKANNPIRTSQWNTHFGDIYTGDSSKALKQKKHLELEARLNALSDYEIKHLTTVTIPSRLLGKSEGPISFLELASFSNETSNIFFRVLFDRLSSDELRDVLLDHVDDYETLLHNACCVMDETSFKQLEEKLGTQTFLEMVTRPVNECNSPLAFACLYNKSTYLFDTVIYQAPELIKKLLKGSPDIDESIIQFMCNDIAMKYRVLSPVDYYQRIKDLLKTLNKQDRFDAVSFAGKSNESALLWACTKSRDIDLPTILTESLDDDQKAELCTAKAKTGNSLVQKCLELNRTDGVIELCKSIRDPLLRFKVMSICTSEGHSLFQQWLLGPNDNEEIKYLLRDMDDVHRDLLIAGDQSIWNQINTSTNHKLRQQEQTPIADAMNRKEMRLAKVLWEQIADPELQIKLLLYKTKHQTTLLKHLLDNGDQWKCFKNRLKNTHSLILRNLFAAELYTHALTAGRFDDAGYYFRQISDSKLKHDLFDDNHKYFLLNLCKNKETITESFFSGLHPYQCTESVVYILEHCLYNKEPLMANLLQLITALKKVGRKYPFIKWVTSPQQGKQCPLATTVSRLATAYRKMNYPENFSLCPGSREHQEKQARLNKQILQGMVSMMGEEQIKEFFLSLQDKSYNAQHLLGYKDILEAIVDTLGDSGRAFLEQINPVAGGNLLHILFESSFIDYTDIKWKDLIITVNWLDKIHALTPLLQGRLDNDGSTPLHVLLGTVKRKSRLHGIMSPIVQKDILKQLCQLNADGLPLVELLKLKDSNGCTPLHKFFSCKEANNEIGDLLIQELGLETFFKLMHIKDKQDNTVMDHCSKLHFRLYEEYNSKFQKLPSAVKVQESGTG